MNERTKFDAVVSGGIRWDGVPNGTFNFYKLCEYLDIAYTNFYIKYKIATNTLMGFKIRSQARGSGWKIKKHPQGWFFYIVKK